MKRKTQRDPNYALERLNCGLLGANKLTELLYDLLDEGMPNGKVTRELLREVVHARSQQLNWQFDKVREELEAMR